MEINKDVNITQTNSINQVRYGCAIGAIYSVSSIPGAMPIVNCGPGCADKQYTGLAFYNGFKGEDIVGEQSLQVLMQVKMKLYSVEKTVLEN